MFRVNTVNPSSNMSKNMFGTDEAILMDKRVCRAISKVQNEMKVAGKVIFLSSGRSGMCLA